MAGVAQKTIYEMRQEVNEKLTRLPLKYYDKHSHGDTLSRAVNDIDNILVPCKHLFNVSVDVAEFFLLRAEVFLRK